MMFELCEYMCITAVVLIWRFNLANLTVDRQIKNHQINGGCNVSAVVATPETPNIILAKFSHYTMYYQGLIKEEKACNSTIYSNVASRVQDRIYYI